MKNSVNRLKLLPKPDNGQKKLSLFLRNQDYYLNRLLNKKGMRNNNNIIKFKENNKDFPFIKIKKIIKVGTNGFFSFKKIDYNSISINRKSFKMFEKINNNHNNKKTLIRYNSCRIFNKRKTSIDNLDNKISINNPLIITHIKKMKVINNNSNSFYKYKRNFSSKSVQKEEAKSINNNYKVNKSTQMNFKDKESNTFFSEKKINRMKIDYCSPKSIIFKRNLMNN